MRVVQLICGRNEDQICSGGLAVAYVLSSTVSPTLFGEEIYRTIIKYWTERDANTPRGVKASDFSATRHTSYTTDLIDKHGENRLANENSRERSAGA